MIHSSESLARSSTAPEAALSVPGRVCGNPNRRDAKAHTLKEHR